MILFVLIGILFAGAMGEVTAAIVSIIGSFAIWEAAAVWIEEMPLNKAKERILAVGASPVDAYTDGGRGDGP